MHTYTDVTALFAPALEAYSAELARHSTNGYSAPPQGAPVGACLCGWQPPAGARRPRVSLGQHVKAANRAADAEYARHADELIRAAR